MTLIIGGAYQGKRALAKKLCGLSDEDIYVCTGEEIDFSRRCIAGLEKFTYACAARHTSAVEYFRRHRDAWADSVLLCEDMSGGVVPLGADMRAWREENGRLCAYLAAEAERVSRVFCGLEQRLK